MALLGHADQLLESAPQAAAGSTARLAAFLARQAVEALIDERCSALTGVDDIGGSMKARLAVLKSLDRTGVGDTLISAWYELSGYCHQHAYELSPTVSQVRGVCVAVAAISASPAPARRP